MAKVYVYKEYNDDYAYGEELVEVYKSKERAKKRLAENMIDCVMSRTGIKYSFEDLLNNVDDLYDEEDTITDEYISVSNGRGGHIFFSVEEKEVIE